MLRVSALDELEELYVKNIIKKDTNAYLPPDYQYFGPSNDGVGNLEALLKYNPFFASALTATPTGFEINPYSDVKTQFTVFTESLDDDVPRVVAEFDRKLRVKSLRVYTGKYKSTEANVIEQSESDKAYLLFNTNIYIFIR